MATTPEGIQVLPVGFQEVIDILKSDSLRAVEAALAGATGLAILYEPMTLYVSFAHGDLSVCGMTVEQFREYLQANKSGIVELASRRLQRDNAADSDEEFPEGEEQDPSEEGRALGLSNGIGVTYTIYHHFLSSRSGKELRAYLKNRRVPHHAKFAKDLEAGWAFLQGKG